MSDLKEGICEELNDENPEGYVLDLDFFGNVADDHTAHVSLKKQVDQIFESVTRIGGEVCRLRSEMDGLLDQNEMLISSFQKLKDVLNEKGFLDMDDFQLACDVFEEIHLKNSNYYSFKKISH